MHPRMTSGSYIEKKALYFHAMNPGVYDLAERLMGEALTMMPSCGIALVWERMRWFYSVESRDTELNPDTGKPLKLNNNYRAYYARWLLQQHPEWQGRIKIREICGLSSCSAY